MMALFVSYLAVARDNVKRKAKPNIIVILADDMGYGDIGAYNPESKIPTPNLDQMAAEGVLLTDAHSPSAVCTPTRYALLTGRYAWRSRLKSGVLWGYSPLLIEEGRETIASLLKRESYATAGIGKWHLGLGNSEPDYYGATQGINSGDDFGRLTPGPNEVGFDYFFGIPASLDMKPYVYIENGRPYSPLDGSLIEASVQRRYGGRGFWRKGQIAQEFMHAEVLSMLTQKAVDYIQLAEENKPFFLYFALSAPHTPWLPKQEFLGKSGAGYYGDFVVQVDDSIGQVMSALDSTGLTGNTLLIFTSDNGAHWLTTDIEDFNHLANGELRGQKADIYEGGHRVPFIARWPKTFAAGTVVDQVTTLTDLMATLAAVVGVQLEEDIGPDSFNILPALMGKEEAGFKRPAIVHHSLDGMFAIREAEWKLIEGLGSGGFTEPVRIEPNQDELGYQLYNLERDPKEANNLAAEETEIVLRLSNLLEQYRVSGRSR